MTTATPTFDGPTFDDYVASRGAALLRLAFMLTGDRHLAEDLTQDVLIRVYGRWSRVSGMAQIDAYVRRSLVDTHVSWRRRRSNREVPHAEPGNIASGLARATGVSGVSGLSVGSFGTAVSVPDDGDAAAERDRTWRLLATLPRKQRAVLVLRFYEDLSDPEIAGLLGCTPGPVRSQASRALATLRTNLQDTAALGGVGRD
jgi:RNA polymerase sigma factor (sigma-70 family)